MPITALNYRTDEKSFFKLNQADTAKDNQKDNEAKRFFTLANFQIDDNENAILPISQSDDGQVLTILFDYKAFPKSAKPTQDKILADDLATILANEIVATNWQLLTEKSPTEKNKERTLLEKHLSDYTAKNTADYFIHKDLGGFLKRELDFYIKNEVMNLDDIDNAQTADNIAQNLRLIQTLRAIAFDIIAFLAQLENFQRRLWEKKKFVADCHYLITLDNIPSQFYDEIFANEKQIQEWQNLYGAENIKRENVHLVINTSLFNHAFQAKLLATFTDLDNEINGTIIHSDNFQALNLLQNKYQGQVKCIYIDPPYNTDGDGFLYKDGYKSSSWLTLMENRISIQKNLMSRDGTLAISIDDNEVHNLDLCVSEIMNYQKIGELSVTRAEGGGLAKRIVKGHDYLMLYARNLDTCPALLRPKEIRGKTVQINGEQFWIETDWLRVEFGKYGTLLYEDIEKVKGLEKKQEIDNGIANGQYVLIPKDGNHIVGRYRSIKEDGSKFYSVIKHLNTDGTAILKNLFPNNDFGYPKPVSLISQYVLGSTFSKIYNNALILDYFAGSGTTAHAVINLNREDNGNRKFILIEQGEYFNTVLKPRIQKVIFAKDYKDGKPVADKDGQFGGISQIVKVLKLESYEDTLNNLQLKSSDLFDRLPENTQNDYVLNYMLNIESRESLLNVADFAKPFDYQLNITTDSAGAFVRQKIDLVETFNYLIGATVLGMTDRRDKEGVVEIECRLPHQTNDDKTLIFWRDCQKVGYDDIKTMFAKRSINPKESQYQEIYINGDHTLDTVWENADGTQDTLKIKSIEQAFLDLMFGEI